MLGRMKNNLKRSIPSGTNLSREYSEGGQVQLKDYYKFNLYYVLLKLVREEQRMVTVDAIDEGRVMNCFQC